MMQREFLRFLRVVKLRANASRIINAARTTVTPAFAKRSHWKIGSQISVELRLKSTNWRIILPPNVRAVMYLHHHAKDLALFVEIIENAVTVDA